MRVGRHTGWSEGIWLDRTCTSGIPNCLRRHHNYTHQHLYGASLIFQYPHNRATEKECLHGIDTILQQSIHYLSQISPVLARAGSTHVPWFIALTVHVSPPGNGTKRPCHVPAQPHPHDAMCLCIKRLNRTRERRLRAMWRCVHHCTVRIVGMYFAFEA